MAPLSRGDAVAVTGASGFIGGWIVSELLAHGYKVRACVRDASNPKADFLKQMPAFIGGQLSLHSCDLSRDGALDAVVDGCKGVVHAAADPDLPLEKRASQYPDTSRLVISSINKASSVSRVIYTSSVASIAGDADLEGFRSRPVINEGRCSDLTNLNGYSLGKLQSESVFFEAAKASGGRWDALVLNPTDNIGPILAEHHVQEREAWTPWQAIVGRILKGQEFPQTFDYRPWWVVDVRDTALAHVRLLESASAVDGSRYLVYSGSSIWVEDVGSKLESLLPDMNLQPSSEPTSLRSGGLGAEQARAIWSGCRVINDKICKDLGMSFRQLDDTLADCARSLFSVAGIEPRRKASQT